MRLSRLMFALDQGALDLPSEGRIAVLRPAGGDDLSALPRDRVVVVTGFFPDFQAFRARGFAVARAIEGPVAAALVCVPRARPAAHAMLAEAAAAVGPQGLVIVDGQKTDGIEAVLRDLRVLLPDGALSDPVTKAHGRLAWFRAPDAPGLSAWLAEPNPIAGGVLPRPGGFSAAGPARGSVVRAARRPEVLPARVVDLGAGWGYLSRAALARTGIASLDLVEAEADALDCARQNVTDPRARFHWADALTWTTQGPVGAVICNPPFHTTRAPDPGLGLGFLRTAARLLGGHGTLWLVANRHLPYDRVLTELFRDVTEIGGDAAFKLTRAAQPRRAR